MSQSLSGKPDYVALEKQNRISHNQTRGFDANPNPTVTLPDGRQVVRGHAKPVGSHWRMGLDAETYFGLFRQMMINKVNGGDTKFMSKLDPEEGQAFLEWLKEKAPAYLRFKMELTRLGVPLMTEDEILAMLPAEIANAGEEKQMVEAEQGTTDMDDVPQEPIGFKKKPGRPAKVVEEDIPSVPDEL